MTLHLVKLCVGIDSVEELRDWIAGRVRAGKARDGYAHVTRMTPRRGEELLAGGSLYWVIRGVIQVRQRLLALRPVTGAGGHSACAIVLEPILVPTLPRPRRPFQGWRYLDAADAPPDLTGQDAEAMPPELRSTLAELGLL